TTPGKDGEYGRARSFLSGAFVLHTLGLRSRMNDDAHAPAARGRTGPVDILSALRASELSSHAESGYIATRNVPGTVADAAALLGTAGLCDPAAPRHGS